ncbi:MAG: hypothetical protein ACRDQ7_15685 [Haloechinothrix sp.]
MTKPFTASRPDGRSDRQVIYDLARPADPDITFTYIQLEAALNEGLEQPVARGRIYRAVAAANKTLLRETRRYLQVVKDIGYKVLRADQHLEVAKKKKGMAQTYLKKGIALLRHARLDELTDAQRDLHEAQLMIIGGLYQAVRESEQRHDRQEQIIDDLRNRVERLEDDA